MNSVLKNVAANFLGQGWAALMGICFVPLYLKFIGIEGYGLIGFFVILSSAMSMLDGGFGAVATKEASVYESASSLEKKKVILLLRSVEWVFWGIALTAGAVVILLAPLISNYWLDISPDKLDSVTQSLRVMGGALVLQFPIAFYYGALTGLQKQVELNIATSIFATFRSGGTVLVFWLVSPTVEWFFIWQCVINLLTVFILRIQLIHELAGWTDSVSFSLDTLRRLRGFAVGVGATNALAFLLMQADKIVLSKTLSLTDFGYYMLAWTLGTIAFRLISPVFNAYYPKIVASVASGSAVEAFGYYIRASQILSMLVIPFSVWIAFYSHQVLSLWTQDQHIAAAASGPLMILVLGTMIHSFMNMPYALQLAHGWTRFSVWQNFIAAVLVVPLTYYLAASYGLAGSAWPWLLLNIGFFTFCPPIVFKKLNIKPAKTWYIDAIFIPLVISVSLLYFFKGVFDLLAIDNPVVMLLSLGITYIAVALRLFVFSLDIRKITWRNAV